MKGTYDTPILPSPRIMNITQGSIKECRNYSILPSDWHYIYTEQFQQRYSKLEETSKLQNTFRYEIVNKHATTDW